MVVPFGGVDAGEGGMSFEDYIGVLIWPTEEPLVGMGSSQP
jgi:hypothetical protein